MKTINFKIQATGYIEKLMREELEKNVLGKLDVFASDLFTDDIYVNDRLSGKSKPKSLGTLENDDEWNAQFYWWNSETISNYYDGLMRYGYLLNDKKIIQSIEVFVNRILESQDDDGYIGIYQKDLRYQFDSENGELWSKATMYRLLLGYYFYTGKTDVLNAVINAVQNVMDHYKINHSNPFKGKDTFAGVAHGLMFVDVLSTLYDLTMNDLYVQYAKFLYDDYCIQNVSEKDILPTNLSDKMYQFQGHGVHTYEHIRVVAFLAKHYPEYKTIYDNYMEKLSLYLSPSGGPVGDEWVPKEPANPSLHGYEFCSIFELMDSMLYVSELQLDNQYELAKKLFFNANFGAKHNQEKTIAYLKNDNSYNMIGRFQTDQPHSPHKIQSRYKYSPTHQDAAVCCVPNSARITPYFLEHAITVDEFVTLHYVVPMHCEITLGNKTYYLDIDQNNMFGEYTIDTNLGDLLNIEVKEYDDEITVYEDLQGDVYFKYKSFVFALPILSNDKVIKEHSHGQKDLYVLPNEQHTPYEYNGDVPILIQGEVPKIKVKFIKEGREELVDLIPISETVLRQVTFKKA